MATTTRRRNSEQARNAILAAARLKFGADGYEPTTIRAVANSAGYDPALVMQYFGNKEGLFKAAGEMDIRLPDLQGVAPGDVAAVLVPIFLEAWRPDGAFLGLLRAASTNSVAAAALADVFRQQVAPVLAALTRDRPDERAALIGAQLLGVAVSRHILNLPALTTMSDLELARWLGPVLAHYLDGATGDVRDSGA